MKCPRCGGKTTVVDTVSTDALVGRYRKCKACDFRYYTTERVDKDSKYIVSKLIYEKQRRSRKNIKGGVLL